MMGAANSTQERAQQAAPGKPASLTRHATSHTASHGAESDVVTREKKKKASKFATLRKKLTRVRRHSRSLDYSKVVRELTASWSIRDLSSLVEEYEASITLKELATAANLARPPARSLRRDLSTLFDYKYCTDVDLIYHGACFPSHRALLSVRCPFFREILAKYPEYGAQVPIKVKTPGVDVAMFAALLRYLYTDDLCTTVQRLAQVEVLSRLVDEFGMPSPLEQDLRTLLETGDYCDAVLVFTSDCDLHDSQCDMAGSFHSTKQELCCHKAVLAARSPFFRNLLLRRARSGEEITERTLQAPTRIVLDESVIPRQYARVLLHAVYLDSIDLSCIVRGSTSMCSLSEVQAMVAGKGHMTHADEAMEIYQIGQFLDFPVLSQGCEDIISDSINLENLTSILGWSSEAHGSKWVHRQAIHFLREEFLQIAHSPILFDLSKEYLIQALRSDFLQAGEIDVLTAVLKWGEHQLIRRMEEREPNLLSHTAHSVSKKGVKKRDLNDVELRDVLVDLLPLVRMDHVIPANNDVLSNAIKRGLVSTPPSHMMADETHGLQGCAWIRGKNSGMYVKPRLFMPYYEEMKALLEEQLSQGQESEPSRIRTIHMSSIPDTLYMVDERQCPLSPYPPGNYISTSTATVDIIAGTIPVPDRNTLLLMTQREHELQQSSLVLKAYSTPYLDKRAITLQLQLRIVREFGLPDSTVEVLQNGQFYYPEDLQFVHLERHYPRTATPRSHRRLASPVKHSSSTPISPTHSYSPVENEASACSDSILNEMMPDIAMATASINQISLQEQDLELDLGDGNGHHGTLYI
ncbi:LOW QUALITY PROTEIN: BTB/POZ domain-containing protein 7-like [Liolophura sinensis]|uniref:LOW QUALITY PROTEIN: BTB/POZ domain-containing protein 7-like n=1 Tax=Liolophura sinensis TaxID=3198878 RepID=UPI003158AB01